MTTITVPTLPTTVMAVAPDVVRQVLREISPILELPPIANGGNAEVVNQALTRLSDLLKKVEAQREVAGKPFFETKKQIDAAAKTVSAPLAAAIAHCKKLLAEYTAVLRHQAEAAQMAALADGHLTPSLLPIDGDETRPVTARDLGIKTRMHRDVEITNARLIPDEFKVIDMAKLRAAVLAGTTVAGAKLVLEERIVSG